MQKLTKQQIIDHVKQNCAETEQNPGLSEAWFIVTFAFLGDKDKSGKDYVEHLRNVAFRNTDSYIKQQIGILHDLVEDKDWELDDLCALGFDERVVSGVDAMTRREGESYFDFVERCTLHEYAIDVKINDLTHNQNHARNTAVIGDYETMRSNKYMISMQYLLAVKKGTIKAGSPVEEFAAKFLKGDPNYEVMRPVFEREGRTLPPQNKSGGLKSQFGGLKPR